MRGVRSTVLGAAMIVLAAGHVAYWYWPRERPGTLETGSLAAGVLNRADLPLRVWIAHPHQNLAFLSNGERGDNWRRGLAGLLAVPEIELPRFGPFALPPANGMALASDETGERFLAVARVYPAIGLLARVAGKLAGNPWLAGGVVDRGGQRLEVRWSGRVWMLRTPGEAWPRATAATPADAVLARIAVERAVGPFPAGSYRLVRAAGHLDLVSSAATVDGARPTPGVLMMYEGGTAGPRATAVLGPGQGSLRGLPSAVSFARQGVKARALPFERLYRLLGVKRRRAKVGGWRLVASDRLALQRGRELLPAVEETARSPGPESAYAVDLGVVRAVSAELESRLEGLPLPDLKELRQWRGTALLLEELAAYDAWSLDVAAGGVDVRMRLWHVD
jgi:hypothetical protein